MQISYFWKQIGMETYLDMKLDVGKHLKYEQELAIS